MTPLRNRTQEPAPVRLRCQTFVLSMIETAVQLSGGKITGGEVRQIIDMGKAMLEHPVDLLDGVKKQWKPCLNIMSSWLLQRRPFRPGEQGRPLRYSRNISRGWRSFPRRTKYLPEIFNRNGIPLDEGADGRQFSEIGCIAHLQLGRPKVSHPFHTTWQHEKVERRQVMATIMMRLTTCAN